MEGNIFPQVIFEVLAPTIPQEEMIHKFEFYSRFGAQEYYVLQPEGDMHLQGWLRVGDSLDPITPDGLDDWVSPLLGIRFVKRSREVRVHGPDGRRWGTPFETVVWAKEAQRRAELASQPARRNENEHQRMERLADKLRERGLDPDAV